MWSQVSRVFRSGGSSRRAQPPAMPDRLCRKLGEAQSRKVFRAFAPAPDRQARLQVGRSRRGRTRHDFRTWILLLLPILCGIVGCGRQQAAAPNPAEQLRELLQTDREFARASLAGGAAEAFRKYLAEDALQLPSGSKPLQGREAIYRLMSRSPAGTTLDWQPQDGRVAESGDLGYTWGHYQFRSRSPEGVAEVSYGKYLNVWIRTPAGWRVLVDMGNQSPKP